MEQAKYAMINEAKKTYKKIYPCSNRKSLSDCFTIEGDLLLFWFNTADNSTHLISSAL